MFYCSLDKRHSFMLVAISLFIAIIVPAVCFADAEKIFKENNQAVVVVVTYDGTGKAISQGSGFAVRRDGVIITNYHVISNAKSIKIKVGAKSLNVVGIIDLDKGNDIAILKVNAKNLSTVKLGSLKKSSIGEKVYVISSPQGLENTLSDGILSGKRETAPGKFVIQITAPISPGSSGGPVFNDDGLVLGVATFLLKDSQSLNFAMPVDVFSDKINNTKVTELNKSRIENYETTAEYWFNQGIAFGEAGKNRDAIAAFKQAITLDPDFTEAYYNCGVAYGKMEMYRESIDAYKQAIRISPRHGSAYNNMCDAYTRLDLKAAAIEACKDAIRIDADDASALHNLGRVYTMSRRYREAIESFKQALRIKPEAADTHLLLGFAYRLSGDKSSALSEYKILKYLDQKMADELFDVIYK